MNANALAKHYPRLTPEERFRLVMAAGARGDEAEQDRLRENGERIGLSFSDYFPYAQAFYELALLTLIELMEDAARHRDAIHRAAAAHALDCEDDGEGNELDPEGNTESENHDVCKSCTCGRFADTALATGYLLRVKADGWKLFCERINVPAFLLVDSFPGFDRLQITLALTEKTAFVAAGFLRWLNENRKKGQPKRNEVPVDVERIADATAKMFKDLVRRWGG